MGARIFSWELKYFLGWELKYFLGQFKYFHDDVKYIFVELKHFYAHRFSQKETQEMMTISEEGM